MFFGLTNSPATFQAMMNDIFKDKIREGWVSIYMDNILIHMDNDVAKHWKYVHWILQKLEENNLYLKPEKCTFEQQKIKFLDVVLEGRTIQMDPTKITGVADWPAPKTVKDVWAFLGFTGFYRYFIPNYSNIARPLIDLTKKAIPFHWDPPQFKAFETMKTLICQKPILQQPHYEAPFFLATDTSVYGMGAVLSQEGEPNPCTQKPTQHPIAYYSAMFTPTERNYDIYKHKLLAILKSLEHWWPHLAVTEIPITVLTDHANLTFWKNPRKVNWRVARWFAMLQDYNLTIKHIPGKLHAAPDMLSWPPNANKGEEDNQNLTLLPKEMFAQLTMTPETEWRELQQRIAQIQRKFQPLIQKWKMKYLLAKKRNSDKTTWWAAQGRMVLSPHHQLRTNIAQWYHDIPMAGHPGWDKTIHQISRNFWWPGMNAWITNFVKGCAVCQQNKNLTHRKRIPTFHIPATNDALSFKVIVMDLITQLPKSQGHNAILTIVDQGCSRAAIFLPCQTTITGEEVAQLYAENIYQWFRLPVKVISDQDPHFTSHFAKALCTKLQIKQNVSMVFHPQTDGLSERKNQ